MKHASLSLDYFALAKEAKALNTSGAAKVIRIALLADCATQHLADITRAIAARNNVQAEVYEGNYDGVDLEILDPNSALYAFNPQYVVILLSSEKLKAHLYASGDRRGFAHETIGRLENLWNAFRTESQATIVQSTFVLPSERAFGNYELKVADFVGSIFTEINYRLAVKAREFKNVLLNDVDFLAASVGRTQWFDARMWNMAKTPCRLEHLPLLAQSLLDTVLAASGMFAKCVVLDLDNTLWGGVIGDDGLEGIALGEFDEGEAFVGFQTFIRELKRRGIILAVVSKNEQAAAVLPFREHPHMVLKEEDISVRVDDLLQVIADDDVAVIAAHQLDRVAGLDGRVPELIRNEDALAVDDVDVGNARQQRACVAWGNLNEKTPCNEFQGAVCDPSPPLAGVLPLTEFQPPDFARRAGLTAARVNLSRCGASPVRGGKTKKRREDQHIRPLVQSHGAILPNTIAGKRKVKEGPARFLPETMGQEKGGPASN